MSRKFPIFDLARQWRLKRRAARLAGSPLFQTDWYLARNPDVREAGIDPVLHYLAAGAAEGRWPHPLFDPDWYRQQLGNAKWGRRTPLEHYLSLPVEKRPASHPLFDPDWYRSQNPEVAEAGTDPLAHFLVQGGREGRSPHRDFDSAWYLERYPDVAVAGVNPLVHYLETGALEGRDPNPDFSTEAYLARYPDVAGAGVNPLVHFVKSGRREGRVAEPVSTRSTRFPAGRGGAAKADHGTDNSDRDACVASGLFDPDWYRAAYPDIGRADIEPLGHFLAIGASEGRNPSPWFDTRWYLENCPEAAESGMNPLAHYQGIGRKNGCFPRAAPKTRFWWDEFRQYPEAGQRLPASPESGVRGSLRRAGKSAGTCVVIPIFNAPDELEACLESVLRNTPAGVGVIAIDDASTDQCVDRILKQNAGDERLEVLANRENLGYTATVNRGIAHAGVRDVVLLNSDTMVGPGWLARLRRCAYSERKIGTATALSNNAGAFSAPRTNLENPLPEGVSFEQLGRAISQTSCCVYPETPTGNGFCMYIRRDCFDDVGPFDDQEFPQGYGEENDFCMRARERGWKHVIDDATYVFHHRSASFGDRRGALVEEASAIINERYPDYPGLVADFLRSKQLEVACRQVERTEESIAGCTEAVKPRVLFVIAALHENGGTALTNRDLMDALEPYCETFLLRSDGKLVELFSYRAGESVLLDYAVLRDSIRAFPHTSTEYDSVVAQWLHAYAIELIHIRHIALHGLGLIEIAKQMWLPVVFSFHDYYTVCPTVKLLDENLQFCGGRCTATRGHCTPELWPDEEVLELKHAAIKDWKKIFINTLAKCDTLVTTSQSAREIVLANYPELSDTVFRVIPHGRDFPEFLVPPKAVRTNDPLKILFPGNVTRAKGAEIVTALAERVEADNVEIHLLGRWLAGEPPENVIVHEPYSRGEFLDRVRNIRPQLGAVLSVWAETWCHTLTELWAAGLPVIGYDFGAVAERIRASGAGWILPDLRAETLVDFLLHLRVAPEDFNQATANVNAWQRAEGVIRNRAAMAEDYKSLYELLNPALESTRTSAQID